MGRAWTQLPQDSFKKRCRDSRPTVFLSFSQSAKSPTQRAPKTPVAVAANNFSRTLLLQLVRETTLYLSARGRSSFRSFSCPDSHRLGLPQTRRNFAGRDVTLKVLTQGLRDENLSLEKNFFVVLFYVKAASSSCSRVPSLRTEVIRRDECRDTVLSTPMLNASFIGIH